MFIEKITIKRFGKICDMTLEFSSGVNVIEGRNEAGKSTIAAFIKYMLFGFDNADSSDVSERRRRINWTSGTAEGSMVVSVGDKRYHISRSTVLVDGTGTRPTYKEDAVIMDLDTGTPAFGKVPAGEVMLGVDRELFENTAFVGQMSDASIDSESVRTSIENILFSGSERLNIQRAASKIGLKMESLYHKGGGGGVIFDLMQRSRLYASQYEQAQQNNRRVLEMEAELHKIRAERDELINRRDSLREQNTCYKNLLIINSFDELHALEEELDRRNEAYVRFLESHTYSGFVASEAYLYALKSAKASVDEHYTALLEAEREYNERKNAIGITRDIEGKIELADELGGESALLEGAALENRSRIKSITGIVTGSLALIATVVYQLVASGALAELWLRIVAGVLSAGSVALVAYMGTLLSRHTKRLKSLEERFDTRTYADLCGKIAVIAEARQKRDRLIASIEDAREALERAGIAHDNARAELRRQMLMWADDVPDTNIEAALAELMARVEAFVQQERELTTQKQQTELAVRELRMKLQGKSEIEIRGLVLPLKRKVLANFNYDTATQQIDECTRLIAERDAAISNLDLEISAIKRDFTDPVEIYNKMQANEARVEELKSEHHAYYLARQAIENASDNLRREISPRLGGYSTELLGVMTDKKYSALDVNGSLTVSFTDSDGVCRHVDFLSGGTRDLAYVAVRMALIDMLYNEKPPIFFDESFAHQDNVRARSMMKAICSLADDSYQSFIFTCRGREAALVGELTDRKSVFRLTAGEDSY